MKNSVILFIFILSTAKVKSEVFNVAIPMIPDYNPITNQINSGNYIGSQMYYPLFEVEQSTKKIVSQFLDMDKTRSIDNSFRNYEMCLKKELLFSDLTEISADDLISSLHEFGRTYSHVVLIDQIIKKSNKCIKIIFKKSVVGLFKKLTGTASTVLKKSEVNKKFPVGLGAYKFLKLENNILSLQSTLQNKPRFSKIDFHLVRNEDQVNSNFHDINQLPPNAMRDKKFENYNRIPSPAMKTYSIVVNSKALLNRKNILSVLSKHDWIKLFSLNIRPSKFFLPWIHNNENNANKLGLSKKHSYEKLNKITFLIPEIYDFQNISDYFKANRTLDIFILKKISAIDFKQWVFSGEEYVALMGFDSSGSVNSLEGDYSVYFESFFSKINRIVTDPVNELKNILKEASDITVSSGSRLTLMKRAESVILDKGLIYPLGYVVKDFVYPRDLIITEWYDYYSGIPKISSIK